jgi:hypothetical protein
MNTLPRVALTACSRLRTVALESLPRTPSTHTTGVSRFTTEPLAKESSSNMRDSAKYTPRIASANFSRDSACLASANVVTLVT